MKEELKKYKGLVDEELEKLAGSVSGNESGFLKDSYDMLSEYILRGGKRLRAISCIKAYEAFSGKKEKRILLPAISLELYHAASLVHDDIMDRDHIRHGQETVHHKWDDGIAILTGDAMLSLALNLLNQSHVQHAQMKIFIDGLLAVCEGQALDKEFETNNPVTLDAYLQMIDLKTGNIIG